MTTKVTTDLITSMDASKLTGTLPAISGANLTNMPVVETITKSATDPTISTNPSGGVGTIYLNTTSGEMFSLTDATAGANVWTNAGDGTGLISPYIGTVATGGTITEVGNFKVHTFTTSGTFAVTTLGDDTTIDYLVVAGGGSGGVGLGSGAGAGGLRNSYNSETSGGGGSSETELTLSVQSYTVTIGGGGAGVGGSTEGNKGEDSVFSTITSIGGGGGSSYSSSSQRDGGSGGGKNELSPVGTGTANQGYGGGPATMTTGNDHYNREAGGGGAGAVGSNGVSGTAGNGGVGVASAITGSSTYYAGGGGGSAGLSSGATQGAGGNGGGGAGHVSASVAAAINVGGGSGGAAAGGTASGNGGSGVVILRYQFQSA